MARATTRGTCDLCGGTFGKAAMTRHLESCRAKMASESPPTASRPRKARVYHLMVQGGPTYWLHLDAPAGAALGDLDDFLRQTWLECCGHLSAFTIAKQIYYSSDVGRELGGHSMNVALSRVLSPGITFRHEYDFGSTTELSLKVVSEREEQLQGKGIRILARNEPPAIACELCGKPATQVCSECIWEGGGWLCDECGAEHGCGEEMFLPVVNSPRVGVCGYSG